MVGDWIELHKFNSTATTSGFHISSYTMTTAHSGPVQWQHFPSRTSDRIPSSCKTEVQLELPQSSPEIVHEPPWGKVACQNQFNREWPWARVILGRSHSASIDDKGT